MIDDESKNMENLAGERYRERSEIKVMNDHYCMLFYDCICLILLFIVNLQYLKLNTMIHPFRSNYSILEIKYGTIIRPKRVNNATIYKHFIAKMFNS